jgi:hypothetical protein
MKKLTIVVMITLMFLASCTITQEYHFNKDFSGNYNMEMEVGELITMLKAMDTTGNMTALDTLDQQFKDISKNYEDAGAKNVEAGWKNDKNTIFITFDFKDVESLNSILKNTGENADFLSLGSNSEPVSFTHKGTKFLSVDLPEINSDTGSLKELEQMKDMLTIETIFSFDRKIKKISNENAEISPDKKSFKFESKIGDMMKEGYTMDTEVKLKRK